MDLHVEAGDVNSYAKVGSGAKAGVHAGAAVDDASTSINLKAGCTTSSTVIVDMDVFQVGF
jgi:hypothetical protein